jgi:hypothetical protein
MSIFGENEAEVIKELKKIYDGTIRSKIMKIGNAYIEFSRIEDRPNYDEDKYKFAQISGLYRIKELPKINGKPDIVGSYICPELSPDLIEFCNFQQKFKKQIGYSQNQQVHRLNPLYKHHVYTVDENNNIDNFHSMSMSGHKGTDFKQNNNETIARYDKNLLYDVHDKTNMVYSVKSKESLQKRYNSLFVLNNLILDMPRHNKEIVIGRYGTMGFVKLGNDNDSSFYKERIDQIIPNITIKSASMCQNGNFRIYVPANFPIYIWYDGCGTFDAGPEGPAAGEGSEVNLPYTTDVTGRSFTYGYRVLKVDKENVVHLRVEYLDKPIPIDYNKLYGKEVYASMYKPEEHDKIGDRIIKVQEMLLKGILPPLPGFTDSEMNELREVGFNIFPKIRIIFYEDQTRLNDLKIRDTIRNKLKNDKEFIKVVYEIWKLYREHNRIGILQSK